METIKLFKDGNMWCVLMGTNLQEGISGFGSTKSTALRSLATELEAFAKH